MADRYQDRPFPTDADHDRGANLYVRRESEPLAELAQLTGQTDLFGTPAKTPVPLQSRANVRPQYALAEEAASAPAGLPPWRLRARQEAPPLQERSRSSRAPCILCSATRPRQPQRQNRTITSHNKTRTSSRLIRHAMTTRFMARSNPSSRKMLAIRPIRTILTPINATMRKSRSRASAAVGIVTVAAVLALAVVGTGAAFAYRTYVGSPRSGEPPIITADNSPTKVVPAQSDGGASKIPDRMPPGGGGEKLVSREEAPVDINSRSGASLVEFPPLNQNSSPPPVASVSPTGPALATAANGTMPNNEPRKIKALTVKGDAAENGGIPAGAAAPAKPDPAARSASAPTAPAQRNPSAANASANAPLTLSPQSAPASDPAPPTRLAATNAVQTAPSAGGGYLVQVSSQKNEADAQASYRALQNKFPAALGSRPPVIKRADLGDKGVYYRTMVGPFGSTEEAAQFCGNLKSAGGQCVIQKNAKSE